MDINELEYDSDEMAWKYYENRYTKFSIDKATKKVGKSRISYECTVEVNKHKLRCEMAGDCVFNFNENKYAKLYNIIVDSKSNDKKEYAIKLLNKCKDKHHSRQNIALMPVAGGMNNLKGNIYYRMETKEYKIHMTGRFPNSMLDRPDTFIVYLDKFFDMKKSIHLNDLSDPIKMIGQFLTNSIFTKSFLGFNFTELYDFMASFDSTVHFCELFYQIDEEFVKKMRMCGKEPINNIDRLISYMELAEEYWKIQDKNTEKENV